MNSPLPENPERLLRSQVGSDGRLRTRYSFRRHREIVLERGEHLVGALLAPSEERWGLLVLDGVIAVHIQARRARSAWLIGAGDIVRPSEMGEISLLRGCRWQALTTVRLVGLNGSLHRGVERDAAAVEELLALAARTAHWLLAKSVIGSAPTIQDRVLLLFSLWAERWGRVTPSGVRIDLPLTHELIASCCGARRPSATIALRRLEDDGFITRLSRNAWLLRRNSNTREPCHCWQSYKDAVGLGPAIDGDVTGTD